MSKKNDLFLSIIRECEGMTSEEKQKVLDYIEYIIYKKIREAMENLPIETRVVAEQYMEPIVHNGKVVYAIRDLKLFDVFTKS